MTWALEQLEELLGSYRPPLATQEDREVAAKMWKRTLWERDSVWTYAIDEHFGEESLMVSLGAEDIGGVRIIRTRRTSEDREEEGNRDEGREGQGERRVVATADGILRLLFISRKLEEQ